MFKQNLTVVHKKEGDKVPSANMEKALVTKAYHDLLLLDDLLTSSEEE